jgi:hypothetical protein
MPSAAVTPSWVSPIRAHRVTGVPGASSYSTSTPSTAASACTAFARGLVRPDS